MALAPPLLPDVDIVVVATRQATVLDALTLLRYLQSVTPGVVVMIGHAWVQLFSKVDSFKDALLADRLEQLSKCGARLYIVDPKGHSTTRIELPRGRKIEVRRDLHLRVDGAWVLFGVRDHLLPPFERLRSWTRAWFGGAKAQPAVGGHEDAAFAKTVCTVAAERNVDTVVLDLPSALLRRIERGTGEHITLASPGTWSAHHQLLEYRYGTWHLTDATRHEIGERQLA